MNGVASGPQRRALPGGRWHFQHGPIDLVIGAEGAAEALAAAHAAAWQRFAPLLDELVAELPLLRVPVEESVTMPRCPLRGPVAQRMWQACAPYRAGFITPMAAVAGAVAEELIGCYAHAGITRAWVNDGGDIALHLAPGASLKVGLYADLACFDAAVCVASLNAALPLDADFEVAAESSVRGVATSGWRGRSFSLGIADSVTVLAKSASAADAAATVIANAVDIDDPRIVRRPACELKDDSDLGERLVTVDVPPLEAPLLQRALEAGQRRAEALRAAGLIEAALLVCQRGCASVQAPAADPTRLAA
jgi:ApbE superfamily uncharacterized protein (UPF0280 family)